MEVLCFVRVFFLLALGGLCMNHLCSLGDVSVEDSKPNLRLAFRFTKNTGAEESRDVISERDL